MEKNIKKDLIIIIPLTIVFMVLSSVISYLKYITFHADVYDLGVSSDLIKNAFIYPIVYNKIIYPETPSILSEKEILCIWGT